MNKSAEEAEREVEASRGELDRTVEALKDKMTPGQLLDEATRTMGGAGSQIFSKFVDQAKENPMPLAVMGLGLAWLMTSNNKPKSQPAPLGTTPYAPRSYADAPYAGRSYTGQSYDAMDSEGSSADGLGDKARRLADGVSDRVSDATHSASEAAGAIGDRVSRTAAGALDTARGAAAQAKEMAGSAADTAVQYGRSAADTAVQYGQRAQHAAADMIDREPLLVAGFGLLAGLAVGAALPATDVEKRYVAPMKDKVIDKTKAMAQDRLEDVSEAAQAAYSAVKDELGKGEGQTLAERADHVVHAAGQSLRDQASGPH